MPITARELYALAPLGARIAVSDGTPRPPDRFNKKLRDWKHRNFSGYFTEAKPGKGYSDHFTIQELDDRVLVINRCVSADNQGSSFEVTPPTPGTILAYHEYEDRIEVNHVWPDGRAGATHWAQTRRYNLAKCGLKYFEVTDKGELKYIELEGDYFR